jgi:hypothetical protein
VKVACIWVVLFLLFVAEVCCSQTTCSSDTSTAPADGISQLVPDDTDPVGTRVPLILIHGISGRDDSNLLAKDGWAQLENYLTQRGIFHNYKIYRFRYESNQQPVSELGRSLRNALDKETLLSPGFDRSIVIIAHSMGGLVGRSFMNEWALTQGAHKGQCGGEMVSRLITLATPHHGTPSANGLIRVPSSFAFRWGELPPVLDSELWAAHFHCFECVAHIDAVNRGDLRYDNLGVLPRWSTNEYVGEEVNSWLLNLKRTYDFKIIAYFGFLGTNSDITDLGSDLPETLFAKFNLRILDEDAELNVLGVLLERITSQIFDDEFLLPRSVNFVYNDGVVPVFSGSFENGSGVKRVSCHGFNHRQILENGDTGQKCNNNLSPFESILQDLNNEVPPPNALIVDPASSWNFGQVMVGGFSDKVFTFKNTGSSALSLTTLSISGASSNEFFTPTPPVLPLGIPGGQSQSVTVRFRPASSGNKQAILNIATDTSTDSAAPITLTGAGTEASCNATLSTTQFEISAAGGSGSFDVTVPAGCAWAVSADPSLVSIVSPSQGLGFGNGSVTFTIPPNPGTLRIASVRFSAGTSSQSVTVIQDGSGPSCNYQLSATRNDLPASGGTGAFTIAVARGCSWMVSSSQPFIIFSSLNSGSGTAGISYSVTPNPNASIRFSTISITTPTSVLTYIVSQDAASNDPGLCNYGLSSTGRAYTAEAWDDAFVVNATSGCTWTANTADSWITLLSSRSPAAGGSGSVGFQVFPNTGSTLRMATIMVQGQGQSNPLTYTIWQQPPSVGSPQIVLPVTNVLLGDVLINTKASQTVQIQNKGNKDLSIAAIFEVSGSQEMFVSSFNRIVVAGGTNTFQLSFAPSIAGKQSGVFRIQSNDPNTPTVDLTVSGNGIPQSQGGTDFVWTTLAGSGPSGLTELATATINNTIYLFSGRSANAYDPTIAQWFTLPDLPHGLIDPGAAVIGGKIYVLGDVVSHQVQIFDPSTKSWSFGAALPDMRESMAVASAGGKLYAMGGILSGAVIGKVAVYDPVSNSWSQAHDMITARAVAAAATVNGIIYVMGGILDQGVRTGVTEIFDPVANTWTNREDMPTRRSHAGVAVLGNDIYVFGGSGNFGTLNVVEKQDTTKVNDNLFLTQTWTEKNPLQTARLRDAAAFVNGKAFVFGGTNDSGEVNTNEEGDMTAAPIAGITETSANFGDIAVGRIGEVAITVENAGNAGLTLSYAFSQPSQEIQIFRATEKLAAGQSSSLILRFVPNSTGSKTASLVITTNDTAHPSITVSLAGNGVQSPAPVAGLWQISKTLQMPAQTVPRYLAISNGNAYVVTSPSGLIGLDLSTGLLKFQSPFAQFPNAFAGIPSVDPQHVYVPLSNGGTPGQVAVVDQRNGNVISYIPAGLQPFASAASQGLVYVTDEVRFTDGHPSPVIAIDAASQGLVTSIPIGFNPNYVAIDPNARRGYVTTLGDEGTISSGVTVFDLVTNTVLANVQTRYNPRSIVLSGGRAYISTDADLEVMDLASNTIVAWIPLPQDNSGVAENMGQIFVLNPTFNMVSVIDTVSLSVVQTLTPGKNPSGIATDPATHIVYVANQGDRTIVALQTSQASFDINCSALSLSTSGAGSATCTLAGKNGFSGTIILSCANLPGSSACSFDSPSVTVGSVPVSVNLRFQSDPTLASGSYSFTVMGTSTHLAREIGVSFNVSVTSPGLRFVPVNPCRVVDTRNPNGSFGGPFLSGGNSRGFVVPDSACGIPSTAQAYSLNVTVVPHGLLGFLTMYPCGQQLPLASTLNSIDGRVKAAAAIVPAGTGGAVCAFVTHDTELVIDINGYFVPATDTSALAFYPLAPCRLVDTRLVTGPLGGPSLTGNSARTFPILSSACNVPAAAQAYSLNFTSVPKGPLGFLTTWPAGHAQPFVSTLNAPTGVVTANAAIVPAGANGDVSVFVTNDSDLVIDINGYFGPPGAGGLSLFNLTPCRVLDTRNPPGSQPLSGTLNVNITASGCSVPSSAQAYVLNATVVPPGLLGYLTLWPQGAAQPLVSTLNALDGAVTSNMAIVPTNNGSISGFALNPAHLVLDISGYFAP